MILVLSVINALIFTIISGFHFYWAMGGKVGFDVVLPSNTDGVKSLNPSKSITFIAACVFLSVAIFYLIKVDLIPIKLNGLIELFGLYPLAIVLIIRAIGDFKYVGFFKTTKNTPFAVYDTRYYSPLCLFLGLSTLVLQLLSTINSIIVFAH